MELFSGVQNLLPHDGVVSYHSGVFTPQDSQIYFLSLMEEIDWQSDVLYMFGKRIVTKRKVAWYGDQPYEYTYSKSTKTALPWTKTMLQIKNAAEHHSNDSYNSCLLNLYHDGSEGMGWHSDDEPELKKHGTIASISFGAMRKFAFKHKQTKETISVQLDSGSMLLMQGPCQEHWQHRLAPTKKVKKPRINLTFRTIS